MHFDAPLGIVVARDVAELVEVEVGAEFAVEARE